MESLTERCPAAKAYFYSFLKVPDIGTPTTYQVTLRWTGAPRREMPIYGDFINISSRVPSEGDPP